MPGVNVITQTRSGPVGQTAPESARYMVSGLTERGSSTAPTLVRSMAEYELYLGDRTSYSTIYDDLATFFEEGGSEAVVQRVIGASATLGTLTLNDKAGTPLATLRVDAHDKGAWSSRLSVQSAAGTLAGTYKLVVTFDGETVHIFDNLVTPADAAAAAAGSPYIKITDLGSVTVAPNNQPAVAALTALSAGTDDRASVTAGNAAAGLDLIGPEWGAGAVACPGYTSAQVGTLLLAHAASHNRIALLSLAKTATVADAKTAAEALLSGTNGESGGILYPWVNIPSGNGVKAIGPEGYAAGARARAHRTVGPWRVPAGEIAQAKYVVSPYVELTRAQGDDLDASQVSAIRTIAGTTRLYGWRSLSTDQANYGLLIGRDVLNYLAVEGAKLLEPYVFQTIDRRGQLLSRVASTLVGLVDPMAQAGGLFPKVVDGARIDPGYSVDVSEAVNPEVALIQNKIAAKVAVRVSPVGSLIELTIVKAGLASQV